MMSSKFPTHTHIHLDCIITTHYEY
jgi:hypothetical protein